MLFRIKKRTCNMQHATLCFLCIYAGNCKNTAWLTMPNKCKGTLTLPLLRLWHAKSMT